MRRGLPSGRSRHQVFIQAPAAPGSSSRENAPKKSSPFFALRPAPDANPPAPVSRHLEIRVVRNACRHPARKRDVCAAAAEAGGPGLAVAGQSVTCGGCRFSSDSWQLNRPEPDRWRPRPWPKLGIADLSRDSQPGIHRRARPDRSAPATRRHDCSRSGIRRVIFTGLRFLAVAPDLTSLASKIRAGANAGGPAGGHGLEARVEAHAFRAVDRHIAEQRALPAAETVECQWHRNRHIDADHADLDVAGKFPCDVAVAGEHCRAVAVLVGVDQFDASRTYQPGSSSGPGRKSLPGKRACHGSHDRAVSARGNSLAIRDRVRRDRHNNLRAFGLAKIDVGTHLVAMFGRDQRTHVVVVVRARPDLQRLDARRQLFEQRLGGTPTATMAEIAMQRSPAEP